MPSRFIFQGLANIPVYIIKIYHHILFCVLANTQIRQQLQTCRFLNSFIVLHPRGKQNQLDWVECFKPAAKILMPASEPQLDSCKGDRTAKREEEIHRSPSRKGRKRGGEQRWCFMGKICRVAGRTSAFKEISRHYSETPFAMICLHNLIIQFRKMHLVIL